jgi:7-cyano-7-deazaguanine reductase
MDDVSGLKSLGSGTVYRYDEPSVEILETFPNATPTRNYLIRYDFPEFTSLCPKTGQPDFGEVTIKYVANNLCVETKSLKLYLFAYRGLGSFMETITNRILQDFVAACSPRWCEVACRFRPRGGISVTVVASEGSRDVIDA